MEKYVGNFYLNDQLTKVTVLNHGLEIKNNDFDGVILYNSILSYRKNDNNISLYINDYTNYRCKKLDKNCKKKKYGYICNFYFKRENQITKNIDKIFEDHTKELYSSEKEKGYLFKIDEDEEMEYPNLKAKIGFNNKSFKPVFIDIDAQGLSIYMEEKEYFKQLKKNYLTPILFHCEFKTIAKTILNNDVLTIVYYLSDDYKKGSDYDRNINDCIFYSEEKGEDFYEVKIQGSVETLIEIKKELDKMACFKSVEKFISDKKEYEEYEKKKIQREKEERERYDRMHTPKYPDKNGGTAIQLYFIFIITIILGIGFDNSILVCVSIACWILSYIFISLSK